MAEAFDWVKPSRLWQPDGQDVLQADFFRPRLLAFDSDDFVERFLAATASPTSAAFAATVAPAPAAGQPLKLFQPIHGQFYLVAGSLCCRLPSFPDRSLRSAEGETAFFVLRRLVGEKEYAWHTSGPALGWQHVTGLPRRWVEGEERQPMMTAPTADGRDLLFGYLPVASRETYATAPADVAVPGEASDPRVQELGSRVGDPLTPPTVLDTVTDAGLVLTLSVYLLLDLWEYLDRNLPDIAAALESAPATVFKGDKAAEKNALMQFLKTEKLNDEKISLATALGKVAQGRATLNQPEGADAGELAALGFNSDYHLKEDLGIPATAPIIDTQTLQDRVAAALSAQVPPVELPKIDTQSDVRYVLRCVYERPQCDPPVHVVSQATQPFTLAPFFDPDAPGRPVRIPLPTDVSIAGMRKFKKNVSFLLSDGMRKKMESIVGKEKDLITNGDGLTPTSGDFAFICSFSIQIIFTVAFFLLLMFVVILNIVFQWLLWFKICLPIPKKLLPG